MTLIFREQWGLLGSMSGATQYLRFDRPFHMRWGGILPEVTIAYESWGCLAAARDNAILLFTGLSPSAHAASSPEDPSPGWWEYMIGPGKPLDTERFFVICVNSLGSCFGSTGPASINPQTGRPYRVEFPELTVEDISRAGRAVVQALGIERLYAVIGASLGGMDALAYAIEYPEEVRDLVAISAATQATPFAIAVRSLQRDIIRSDPNWNGGYYDAERWPVEGMRLARKLGLMSYRSGEEWLERFDRERVKVGEFYGGFEPEFQIESYLEANARKFIANFDPNSYLYISRAMDHFDLAEHGEGLVEQALARIQARRVLIAGVETDFLFPLWQQRELAELATKVGLDVEYHPLASIQGHDSFLVDKERFAPVIKAFFAGDPAFR